MSQNVDMPIFLCRRLSRFFNLVEHIGSWGINAIYVSCLKAIFTVGIKDDCCFRKDKVC